MKTIIIEDEPLMARALERLILDVEPEMVIVTVLQSIEDSVEWLSVHPMPDLIFMDIQLADGLSFSIFEEVTVRCPVIFTTAYDEYALQAFEVNSIDYLLKPIDKSDMERAFRKFKRMTSGIDLDKEFVGKIVKGFQQGMTLPAYKNCFLFSEKDKLIPLKTDNIFYLYMEEKVVKVVASDDREFYADQTLDKFMQELDPALFFRVNRQYIVAKAAVKDLTVWFGNKLSVNLKNSVKERITVSRSRTKEFKEWFSS